MRTEIDMKSLDDFNPYFILISENQSFQSQTLQFRDPYNAIYNEVNLIYRNIGFQFS